MTTRKYSSRSQQTTLTGTVNPGDSTINVVSGSALLGGVTLSAGETFTIVINPDTALEEIVDIYSAVGNPVSGNILTIQRNIDGSTAQSHSAGAVVRHMAIGRDYREANTHIENTTTAHGLTIANVLETTDTNMITTAMLQANAVTTAKIADLNVTTGKLADGAVTSAKIADLGIATGDIADAAITSGKIATGAVGTTKIDDLSVTEGKLAPNAVTSAKIADGTIVTGDLADGAVTSAKILDGTIVNADINSAAAIDKTKISGTAITAADTGTVTSTMIADGTIVNADVNSSAQIAYSKTNLTNSIVNADINASAAIDWSKLGISSTVDATEIGYVNGVTSAIQTQIDSKLATSTAASTYAPLASPALTGVPTAPTAAANTNTTQIATTAYVQTEIADLIAAAPGALDTLDELAAALGDDANFATTVTNNLATKLPLAGGTMSGAIAMGTNKITGMGNPTLAQDAATKYYVDNVTVAPSNLTGPITSVGSATSVASQTGTGSTFVMNTSPTLVTPVLGVATATSINGTTIPTSKTLVATDSTTYVVPSQTGNAGKFLTTNGTTSSWSNSITGALGVAEGIGSTSAVLQIGNGRTADGNAYIDLIGDTTYTDYALRIIRASGANGVSQIIHRGTNNFALTTTDAASMVLQTNATTRMVIDSAGNVGIGTGAPAAGQLFSITKDLTGSTSPIGVNVSSTIQSDVTANTRGFNTFISTAATAFTVPIIYHYRAAQGAFGAGSTVTSQYGFYAETTLTDAGTNVGFYGNIAASSGRFNFYANGTAANFFAGRTGIGATLTSGAMAQVVNTTAADVGFIIKGAASQTGDLLQVQNSAGTSLVKVDSSGRIGIGLTTPIFNLDVTSGTAVGSTAGNQGLPARFVMPDGNVTALEFTTIRTSAGSDWTTAGPRLQAKVDATYMAYIQYNGGNTSGISFGTGSSATPLGVTERMRIDSSGNTTINAVADATTTTAARGGGYMGIPQSAAAGSGAYTVVAADAGEHIYTTTTRTVTIPANASVAFPVGTVLSFISGAGATTTIAITTDTMYLAGAGTTGSRTLAAHGMATAVKVASTTWYISGNGLS